MKHKRFFFASLFCLFFAVVTLTTCTKNNDCIGIIYTCTEKGGVRTPVGGCTLIIGEEDFAPEIRREVITDASGRYEGVWPARTLYLPVKATKQNYSSMAFLKLEPGNTTELILPLD
jgi:hypothetical protein